MPIKVLIVLASTSMLVMKNHFMSTTMLTEKESNFLFLFFEVYIDF